MKIGFTFLICICLISCQTRENCIKEYHSNGNLKVCHYYDIDNKLDSSISYSREIKNLVLSKSFYQDSLNRKETYHINGSIKSKGRIDDNGIRLGNWNFYDNEAKLESIKEFVNIKDKEYLNQNWVLNKEGDTIFEKSKIVEILLNKDTISLNEPVRAVAYLRSNLFKGKNSRLKLVLSEGYESLFDENFNNEDKILKDTFYDVEQDTLNAQYFEDELNRQYLVAFGKWFKTPGNKVIRGIAVEYYGYYEGKEKKHKDISLIPFKANKTYFEKPIYVKDSIK